jgi:crotonobetainyl-CoA:carnitine CoA-transferase CaiB-like acyl-CoA transferase
MHHPLDGITVVALERAVAAPFATRQLADLGARVIKVERPGAGDFARGDDRTGARHPSITPYGPHRTRDGSVFFSVRNDELTSIIEAVFETLDAAQVVGLLDRAGIANALLPPVVGWEPVMGAVPAPGERTEAIRAEFQR